MIRKYRGGVTSHDQRIPERDHVIREYRGGIKCVENTGEVSRDQRHRAGFLCSEKIEGKFRDVFDQKVTV